MAKSQNHPTITLQFGRHVSIKEDGKFVYEFRWFDAKTYTGRVGDALIKLTDAKEWGVHKSEFRPDVFARLDQEHIPVEFFRKNRCGTDKCDFVKLTMEWRIVPESAVAA